MTLQRFGELAASYGANPERWPEDERQAGVELLRGDARAADMAAQAGLLDRLLADLPEPAAANAALKDRLETVTALPQSNNITPAQPANRGGRSIFAALFGGGTTRSLIPQAAGLTMICLVGGVALGLSGFAAAPESTLVVDPSAYFFGDPGLDKDLEELD